MKGLQIESRARRKSCASFFLIFGFFLLFFVIFIFMTLNLNWHNNNNYGLSKKKFQQKWKESHLKRSDSLMVHSFERLVNRESWIDSDKVIGDYELFLAS